VAKLQARKNGPFGPFFSFQPNAFSSLQGCAESSFSVSHFSKPKAELDFNCNLTIVTYNFIHLMV